MNSLFLGEKDGRGVYVLFKVVEQLFSSIRFFYLISRLSLKEFGLADQLESENKKCRLLKYDTYNDLIEQSYKKETETTVFEAVGFTKFPYNFCWYLELVPLDQAFLEYHSNEYKVKVINLNLQTLETVELFFIRLSDDARVSCLRERIAQKLNNCDPLCIRMALEKTNAVYNYVYLNDNVNDMLRTLNFTRVCKVFIETEEKPSGDVNFLETRFFYALDATANMIHMSVYLPNDEQCELFKLKAKRRLDYIELQNQLIKKSRVFNKTREDSEDLISLSDINVSESSSASSTVPITPDADEFNMYLGRDRALVIRNVKLYFITKPSVTWPLIGNFHFRSQTQVTNTQ